MDTIHRDNFIKAVKIIMADQNIDTIKAVAEYVGIPYLSLYKIMNREKQPTIEQCNIVILKGGFSANWLYLNKGAKLMGEVATLEKILKRLS